MSPWTTFDVGDSDDSHVVVAQLSARASKQYKAAFENAIDEFRTHYPEEELIKLIEERGVDAADGIDFGELLVLFASMAVIHANATRAAGAVTAEGISGVTGEELIFQMTADMADQLRGKIADDLNFLIQSSKRGADEMVRLLLEEGLTPEEAAKRLFKSLGLDQNRMRRWRKFEDRMRFESRLEDEELERRIDEFAAALIEDRARGVGGDEAWSGSQQGRQFAFELGVGVGILTAFSVKIWNTMRDELVCPRCGPMHGQRVPIMMTFQSPYDGSIVSFPPLHVKCRCWTTWNLL